MTEWKDKTAAEKAKIYEDVFAVYDKHGNPSWLQKPESSMAYVNVLMA